MQSESIVLCTCEFCGFSSHQQTYYIAIDQYYTHGSLLHTVCSAGMFTYFNPLQTAVMESCPRLRPPENTDNYLVHVDHTYGESPLVITAENLDQFSESFSDGEFRCVVRVGADQLFATSAILNSEKNVECARNRVSGCDL